MPDNADRARRRGTTAPGCRVPRPGCRPSPAGWVRAPVPRANEAAAPWLAGLKLGSRIHLVQELLRLLPPRGTGGRA